MIPDSQRTSQLIALKRTNPALHMVVKASLEQLRSQARSVGQQMAIQQQYGQGGGG
jgi:hypothetical protein